MHNKKGMGPWFLRGNIWCIKFYRSGRRFRESSKSTKESDAIELLKARTGEICRGTLTGNEYKNTLTLDRWSSQITSKYTQLNARVGR